MLALFNVRTSEPRTADDMRDIFDSAFNAFVSDKSDPNPDFYSDEVLLNLGHLGLMAIMTKPEVS